MTPELSDLVEAIPALQAFAFRFARSRSENDDLVQETLLKAQANLDQFRPGTKLKSWLFTIMRNTFINKYRRERRELPVGEFDETDLPAVPPTQEWGIRKHELAQAICSLPRAQREILVLVTVLDLSYDDTAKICDCSMGTVKSRLNRARKSLSASLGGD